MKEYQQAQTKLTDAKNKLRSAKQSANLFSSGKERPKSTVLVTTDALSTLHNEFSHLQTIVGDVEQELQSLKKTGARTEHKLGQLREYLDLKHTVSTNKLLHHNHISTKPIKQELIGSPATDPNIIPPISTTEHAFHIYPTEEAPPLPVLPLKKTAESHPHHCHIRQYQCPTVFIKHGDISTETYFSLVVEVCRTRSSGASC